MSGHSSQSVCATAFYLRHTDMKCQSGHSQSTTVTKYTGSGHCGQSLWVMANDGYNVDEKRSWQSVSVYDRVWWLLTRLERSFQSLVCMTLAEPK